MNFSFFPFLHFFQKRVTKVLFSFFFAIICRICFYLLLIHLRYDIFKIITIIYFFDDRVRLFIAVEMFLFAEIYKIRR